ncbi:MAG: JAB domain-containing protein [Kaistella sp.]|nr:JAB domain-containing protein [Kaistella sp.]
MNESVAEIQVSYNPSKVFNFKIEDSRKSFELILQKWEQDRIEMQEEVKVLLLNRNNKVLGIYALAKGGITSCVVDVRIILAIALKTLATGIILVHNHPSGNLNPSNDDRKITAQLNSSCKLMGITLVDHLIITKEDYFSFADEGLL